MERIKLKSILDTVKYAYDEKDLSELGRYLYYIDDNIHTYNGRYRIQKDIDLECPDFAVEFGKINQFVNKVKSKDITLKVKDDTLVLKAGRSTVSLPIRTDLFPKIKITDTFDAENLSKLPADFYTGLELCSFSVQKNASSVLGCIYVTDENIVSSDNYRVSLYTMQKSIFENMYIPFDILPILKKYKFEQYYQDDGSVFFVKDDYVFSFLKPAYDTFIPYNTFLEKLEGADTCSVVFNPNTLNDIEVNEILTPEEFLDKKIHIYLDGTELKITSADSSSKIETVDTLEKNTSHTALDFKIHPIFFKDILNITREIKIAEKLKMATIQTENYTHLFSIQTT